MAVSKVDRTTMPGDGDRSEQVITLFSQMLRLQQVERKSFLREKCAGDEDLHRELSEMLEWEVRMGGFLRDPLIQHIDFEASERPFQPGQMVAGRFEINHLVGEGGMGVVYEAFDTKRGQRIAIKCAKPGFGRLLSPELEGALKVRHPNICLVNDTHTAKTESGDVDFLTMEFLEGKTLSAYLRENGKLEISQALEIARQLCAGVAAAHGSGILHKDLKSSNVILTRTRDGSLRAVITDFGLASEIHLDSELEGGTPDYMAPELLKGAPATKQSDIFALGAILYEIVTGAAPFESVSTRRPSKSISLSSLSRVQTSMLWPKATFSRRLVPARRRVPGLPSRWNRTILRCLDSHPGQRFASAESVLAALEGEPSPIRYQLKRMVRGVRRSRELQVVLGAVILTVAVAGFRWFYRCYIQMPEIPPGTRVLVADVTSSEPQFSGIGVALMSQLEQSARFDVVSDEEVNKALKQMKKPANTVLDRRTAREATLRCGATLVIFSLLSGTPQDYVLEVSVERARSTPWLPAASWSQTYHARDQKDLLVQVHNAALWVRRVAGEREADIAQQDRPVEDTTTSSWQALQLYEQANQKKAAGDSEAALVLLDEAIEADPQFAMAHMRKADILIAQRHYNEGYSQWQKAIELTDKAELTSRENLRIKGLYYKDIGDLTGAEKSFHEYTIHYPNDFFAWFYWGSTLFYLNRNAEAVEAFGKAATLNPKSEAALFNLAQAELANGNRQGVDRALGQIVQTATPEWGNFFSAYLELQDGQVSTALQMADKMKKSDSPEWRSRGYTLEANILSEAGRRSEAISVLQEGMEHDRRQHDSFAEAEKSLALAYLSLDTGERDQASQYAVQAWTTDQSPLIIAAAATMLARTGNTGAAETTVALLKQAPEIPRIELFRNQVAGEIALTERGFGAAQPFLAKANALASPAGPKEWLAHAFLVSGRQQEYEAAARQILARPIPLLYDATQWPGIWADTFEQLATHRDIAQLPCAAARQYVRLRSAATGRRFDSTLLDVQEFARKCSSQN